MHQRYKSQAPLQLTPSTTASAVSRSSVVDLSSTLLNTSIQLPSAGTGSTVLPGGTASSVCWASTAMTPSQAWNSQPQAQRSSAPVRTVDMSALDNIMPMGGKLRPTLNSMVQPGPASGPNPFGPPTTMMQHARFGQTTTMMPGVSSQMGIAAPLGGGVWPMMPGNSGMMGGISQASQQPPSTNAAASLSNKDIADLLG